MEESRGKTLDTVALAALVALWAETIVAFPGLPDSVATSFGNDGTAQAYGPKFEFFLMPVIASAIFGVVWLTLRMKTIVVNVPFEISQERLDALMPMHRFAQRLIRGELLLGFVAMQWILLESARTNELAPAFLWVTGCMILGTFAVVGWYLYRLWSLRA